MDKLRDTYIVGGTNPSGDCSCPPDSPNQAEQPPRLWSNLRLAVTGEQRSTSVMLVQGISPDEWCGKPTATPTPLSPASGRAPCERLLPPAEVKQKLGGTLSGLSELPKEAVPPGFTFVCAWLKPDPRHAWGLSGAPHDRSAPPPLDVPGCEVEAHNATISYCVNERRGHIGGDVMTRRWSLVAGRHRLRHLRGSVCQRAHDYGRPHRRTVVMNRTNVAN